MNTKIARILISCPDKKGIVASVSNLISKNNGNIIQSDQYTTNHQDGKFFMRLEIDLTNLNVSLNKFEKEFEKIADEFKMDWKISHKQDVKRMAIFVSKQLHCLQDLLWRWKTGAINVQIPFIISNHIDAKKIAEDFEIDFYHFPIEGGNKSQQEEKILDLLKNRVDFIVLARYMQIIQDNFIKQYQNKIINIHHSFLPSFIGAKPYDQAYARGVKIIGATAHFATANLDEGPIIEQEVIRISHKDDVQELLEKGQDIERTVFARAIKWYVEDRIIVDGNKTIVFD